MLVYLLVGIGGMIGAVLRYAISLGFATAFPIATLLTNFIGTFVLAWFSKWSITKVNLPKPIITAISTGIIGSFTTFSTFSVETITLVQKNHLLLALLYVFASIVGGLVMAFFGFQLGKVGRSESK